MKPIILPDNFNYIGAFLTFACTLNCSYCINHHGELNLRKSMSGDDWIKGINRIVTKNDLPVTLQGGEPTFYKRFYQVVNGVRKDIPLDLLTNLQIDVIEFMNKISPQRFKRDAKYASIRVSYHNGQMSFIPLIKKVVKMQEAGYSIGVWEIDHPDCYNAVRTRQITAHRWGIDYRLKEYLGDWNGEEFGTMRYPNAIHGVQRHCECRNNELLIGPAGYIYRCHSDLYAGRKAIGHILDENPPKLGKWRRCAVYGMCNPCDIKIKTNRFQEFGHSSVEVRNVI